MRDELLAAPNAFVLAPHLTGKTRDFCFQSSQAFVELML
jgi:hypothetical protein